MPNRQAAKRPPRKIDRPRNPHVTLRATTFTDRRKEADRRACRTNSRGRYQ